MHNIEDGSYHSIRTCPVVTLYLYSLKPGLLAPVSGASVDLQGVIPGTKNANVVDTPVKVSLYSFQLSV